MPGHEGLRPPEDSNQPHEAIKVRKGVPFKISLDLRDVAEETKGCILLRPVELEIEGLGRGRIEVIKQKLWNFVEQTDNANAPLGEFDVRFAQVEKNVEPTPETLPLTIELYIEGLTKEQLNSGNIKAMIVRDSEEFQGVAFGYDEVIMEDKGAAPLIFQAWKKASEEGEPTTSFFPQDPWLFDEISFEINF